jgi:hypothetical protein
MAHFAEIDENGNVLQVQVINNADIDGGDFPQSEALGQALQAELGIAGTWLQCSYSGSFRGAYPGPGWTYDAALDQFVFPPDPPIDPNMPVRVIEVPKAK